MEKNKYSLETTNRYERGVKKIAKTDKILARRIILKSDSISLNPYTKSLGTHVVNTSSFGRVYSSSVNNDIRILWIFKDDFVILLLDIGGHSGSGKVYK